MAESRRNGNSSSEAAVPGSGFAEQSGNPNAISGAFAGSQVIRIPSFPSFSCPSNPGMVSPDIRAIFRLRTMISEVMFTV